MEQRKYNKTLMVIGRKTLGLRSFVSNFSQALSALYAALGLQSDNEVD